MIKSSENLGPNYRQLRVGELIKQNLGQIFIKNEAKIPTLNTNLGRNFKSSFFDRAFLTR